MVYAADSKSAARKGLRVQVSSPAPTTSDQLGSALDTVVAVSVVPGLWTPGALFNNLRGGREGTIGAPLGMPARS